MSRGEGRLWSDNKALHDVMKGLLAQLGGVN